MAETILAKGGSHWLACLHLERVAGYMYRPKIKLWNAMSLLAFTVLLSAPGKGVTNAYHI